MEWKGIEWNGMDWIGLDWMSRRRNGMDWDGLDGLRSLQSFPIIRFRMHKAMKEQEEERKTMEE